ncbi:coiled-coil domain-containing protein 107 isoform X2 [Bombina bombina]|nr:coiled-coil domain-containing protein 107 isoform X2 [Bombina bombina]
MRSAMEQELKSEKASGNGRSMAFTLMPLYAIGVAVFAAYKFSKLKSEEKSQSKTEKEVAGKKSKETENQLLELEHHLAQTEQMLSALLTELDPISNCVNSLGNEQKGDLMNQLQSIRQLMKKSGMNTSSLNHPANQNCSNALEDLIHSFEEQEAKPSNGEDVDAECEKQINREETDSQCEGLTEDLDIQTLVNDQEDDQCGTDLTINNTYEGLRQRNIKDYLQSTN